MGASFLSGFASRQKDLTMLSGPLKHRPHFLPSSLGSNGLKPSAVYYALWLFAQTLCVGASDLRKALEAQPAALRTYSSC